MVTEEAVDEVQVVKGSPRAPITGEDEKELRDRQDIMREHFAKQKKVRLRVREQQWVQVNDYTFVIAANEWVEVPQQIADILEETGRL